MRSAVSSPIGAFSAILTFAAGVSAAIQINGAGATFPYPIYSKWFAEYNRLHPEIRINYQSQGSGAGIRQLTNRTVDFGASDDPMTDGRAPADAPRLLYFPTVVGAVVPIYNLPGLGAALTLSGPVLADISLGKITKWSDPAIARLNPRVQLPSTYIAVVHRAEGSGTTYIWADYLAKVSPEFRSRVGVNSAVSWPTGVGGRGNEGVAGLVKLTPGALGYVEMIYALQTGMPFAAVLNREGEPIAASVASVAAAAAGATAEMPADFRLSITDRPGPGVYPITSFTWLLLPENPPDKAKAQVMVEFLRWALTEGQKSAVDLGYAPLPAAIVKREIAALARVRTS